MYGSGPSGAVSMQVEVTLYPDSGATLNAAGDGWQAVLCLDDDELISAKAAGGNDLKPLCTGTVDLFFPATASLVSRRVADFPGGMYGVSGGVHVKVASSGTHMSSGDVMLLEGPMHRVTTDPRSDSRLNGYPLSSHGESTTPQDGLATVFGLFGTPNFPRFPTGPIKCQVGHHSQQNSLLGTLSMPTGSCSSASSMSGRGLAVREIAGTLFFSCRPNVWWTVDSHRRVQLTSCCVMAQT